MRESEIQIALLQYLQVRGIDDCIHVPNEQKFASSAKNKWAYLARIKKEGVRGGVPDLLFLRRRWALELKSRGGTLTQKQKHWLKKLEAWGWQTGVAKSLDEAIALIEEWNGSKR